MKILLGGLHQEVNSFAPGRTTVAEYKRKQYHLGQDMIDLAASFIPLPGGTGVSELSFNAMFAMFFGGATIWAMLLYRFLTYYVHLLIGLVLTLYDFLYGKRKYQWLQKQRALQAESRDFRQEQIKNFRDERATRRKRQVKN
jgi:hypothetical protein